MKKIKYIILLLITFWTPLWITLLFFNIRFQELLIAGNIVLLIIYIRHAQIRKELTDRQKYVWTVIFLFTTSIGMLVYYFIHIWPKVFNKRVEGVAADGYTSSNKS